jgi:ribose transport system permease protein
VTQDTTPSPAAAPPQAPAPPAEPKRRGLDRETLSKQLHQGLAFGTLVLLLIFFSLASQNFFTFSNITTILLSTAVIGILALGTTFVIITGGIDLSIGTGMTLCSVTTALAMTDWGMPLPVALIVGLLTGALLGVVNGLCISFLHLPPFIATLGTMLICQGLALVISGVRPVYTSSVPDFRYIALGALIPGIPNAVLILFALAIVAWFILAKTILGRYTYAIGSNEEATRLSGIDTRKWKIIVYTLGGLFTGAAGIVIASRLNSAQPQLGVGYELQAIAAVIIGGTSLLGGRGTIMGTLIGALIMSVLINGLRIMSIQSEWQNVVVGVVIIIAVWADTVRQSRAAAT